MGCDATQSPHGFDLSIVFFSGFNNLTVMTTMMIAVMVNLRMSVRMSDRTPIYPLKQIHVVNCNL